MITLFLSLRSFTLTLFIILLSFCTSNGESENHKHDVCSYSLLSCGMLKDVGYPFWGSWRPPYCGHPDLQLKCQADEGSGNPVLTVGEQHNGVDYEVLGITNTSKMTIKLRGHFERVCPFNNSNKVFDKIFRFSESVEKINISNICWDNLTPMYYPNKTLSTNQSCNCLEVPVLTEELKSEVHHHSDNPFDVSGVLDLGFEVNYRNYSACVKCKESKGTCGSNYKEFACFDRKPASADHWKLIFESVVAATGSCILIVLVFFIRRRTTRSSRKFSNLWRKPEGKKYQNIDAFLKVYGSSLAPKRYTYAMARKITNNFSEKLGEGGYAIVYKGKLSDGRIVAVKLLKQSKGTGEDFINEVASISRTNHVNIVALLGFCFEGNKRALIYEFMSNGSLDKFAYHGAKEHALQLETLLNIGVGIATGLDYLHRGCNARILHFDIKPHNILLDDKFQPKISDFGLARLGSQQESTISSLFEAPRGTVGYIAPEVFCRTFGGVSHKSDVYSYGMMILDIVCGRKNMIPVEMQSTSEMYFPQWIYKRLQHGEELANHGNMNDEEKAIERKMILVSLWCIQTYPSNRPSMTKVIEMLQGDLESLPMPPESHLSSSSRSANNSLEIISLAE